MNGGMKYGSGLTMEARLARLEQQAIRAAIGAEGLVLVSDGTDAVWQTPPGIGEWHTFASVAGIVGAGVGATTWFFSTVGSLVVSGTAAHPALFMFNTDMFNASPGHHCEVRLVSVVHTNAANPTDGSTYTCGLQTVGPTGGGAGVIGWGVTGSPLATVALDADAGTTMYDAAGTAATIAGNDGSPYALYLTTDTTTVANSRTGVYCQIQVRCVPD